VVELVGLEPERVRIVQVDALALAGQFPGRRDRVTSGGMPGRFPGFALVVMMTTVAACPQASAWK